MKRQLSNTHIKIAPVALGCWPLAGMTSGDIGDEAAVEIVHAAIDAGINHLDTAHAYGRDGESEVRVGKALTDRRDEVVLATKVGLYWNAEGELNPRFVAGGLATDVRSKSPKIEYGSGGTALPCILRTGRPRLRDSAGELKRLCDEGKTRSVGVSNTSVEEMEQFAAECPIAACQPRYNMLQRDIGVGRLTLVHRTTTFPSWRTSRWHSAC